MTANPTSAERIGALIRRERHRAGLSQRSLAERTGLGQSRLARWETGRHSPTLDQLDIILEYFDVRLRLDLEKRPDPAVEWARERERLASMTPAERLAESDFRLAGLVDLARKYGVETVVDGQLAALLHGMPGEPRRMQVAVLPSQVLDWLTLTWVVRCAVDEDLMTIHVPKSDLAEEFCRDGGGLLSTICGYVRLRVVEELPPTVRLCLMTESEITGRVEAEVVRLDALPEEFRVQPP